MVERLDEMPKPIEDGFPYDVETDSLADSLGLRLPNRSLILLQGESLIILNMFLIFPVMNRCKLMQVLSVDLCLVNYQGSFCHY